MALDPEVKCYMPGIPRATYLPYPFQIVQSSNTIVMDVRVHVCDRVIRMDSKEKSPAPAWMGWNIGHWDGKRWCGVTDQWKTRGSIALAIITAMRSTSSSGSLPSRQRHQLRGHDEDAKTFTTLEDEHAPYRHLEKTRS